MIGHGRWWTTSGAILTLALHGGNALAEQKGELVGVVIQADSGETTTARIFPDGADPDSAKPLEACRMPCDITLPRGRYKIRVEETHDTLGGDRRVTIQDPSRVTFSLSRRSTRSTGLTLGLAGVASLGLGAALLYASARPEGFGKEAYAAVALGAVGAVLLPVGFVMYGTSFHTGVDVKDRWSAAAPRTHVGLVALPGGGGVGGCFVF